MRVFYFRLSAGLINVAAVATALCVVLVAALVLGNTVANAVAIQHSLYALLHLQRVASPALIATLSARVCSRLFKHWIRRDAIARLGNWDRERQCHE